MRKYVGDGWVADVPCQDLTEEEWETHVRAGRIKEGTPAAANWKKVDDSPKAGKEKPAREVSNDANR